MFLLSDTMTKLQEVKTLDTRRPNFRFKEEDYKVQISIPAFENPTSFDFCESGNVEPKHTFHGLQIGGTLSNKRTIHQQKLPHSYTILNIFDNTNKEAASVGKNQI